jgi:general secretion pathway protein B
VPKLAVTGGVYSQSASQRMLIVNGQVFNEGGEPAPGVKLEQIRPNVAVLSYQGQRFTVKY